MSISAAAPPTSSIQLARVRAGAKLFKDLSIANISDTYRGQILIGPNEVRTAIIKDIPLRELANELLAAALGSALSLPVPPAFIAVASQTNLPAKNAPKLGGLSLVFASADVGSPSVAQLMSSAKNDPAAIRAIITSLMQSGCLGDLYGFDSWTANIDRHVGNLLFAAGRSWFIDHGRCFTGHQWTTAHLDASAIFRNRLKDWLTPQLSQADRARYADGAKTIASRMKGVAACGTLYESADIQVDH
jgi:hypothetical protein